MTICPSIPFTDSKIGEIAFEKLGFIRRVSSPWEILTSEGMHDRPVGPELFFYIKIHSILFHFSFPCFFRSCCFLPGLPLILNENNSY